MITLRTRINSCSLRMNKINHRFLMGEWAIILVHLHISMFYQWEQTGPSTDITLQCWEEKKASDSSHKIWVHLPLLHLLHPNPQFSAVNLFIIMLPLHHIWREMAASYPNTRVKQADKPQLLIQASSLMDLKQLRIAKWVRLLPWSPKTLRHLTSLFTDLKFRNKWEKMNLRLKIGRSPMNMINKKEKWIIFVRKILVKSLRTEATMRAITTSIKLLALAE